ncbi:MAG TPA: hypothetical protein VF043_35185 [Ktedonobacteraceae bacterium]
MENPEEIADIVIKAEALGKAEQAKRRRFTRRGLVLTLLGIVFIAIGIVLNTGPASSEGLFVAIGVIILISAIISFLIGVINPFFSDVVRRRRRRRRQRTEIG